MASWLTCILTGRHEFTKWCEPGVVYLRCTNCGRRTEGWKLSEHGLEPEPSTRASLSLSPKPALRLVRQASR